MSWIIARLKERSTWLGLVSLASAIGLTLSPELSEAIVSIGLAIGGAIAALWPDHPAAS